MARLERGVDKKIDHINELVALAQSGNRAEVSDAIEELLIIFKPLLYKLCAKWSSYFDDKSHNIKSFDELYNDSQYWFSKYTIGCGIDTTDKTAVYDVNGTATYNTYIKTHLDQRIRYIYECELKYRTHLLFPDPNKYNDDGEDMFDTVVRKYSGCHEDEVDNSDRVKLSNEIISIVQSRKYFNEREQEILLSVLRDGITHDEVSKRFQISRTRVVQILRKAKARLYKLMENNQAIWELIFDCDIEFKEVN